jgi:hypothetical protein
MRLKLLSTLLILTIELSVFGQSTAYETDKVLKQYNNLNHLTDDNEKTYQLKELSDKWLHLIKKDDFSFPQCDTLAMKCVASQDNKYVIYYYLPKLNSALQRVDMFICYNKASDRIGLYFSEFVKTNKENGNPLALSQYKLDIVPQTINNVPFNEIRLTNNGIQLTEATIPDIELKCLFEEMRLTSNDDAKLHINDQIISRLKNLFEDPLSFSNPFRNLNRVSTIISSNQKVKICTWNIEFSNFTNRFFGSIITKTTDGNIITTPLNDNTSEIKTPERASLTAKKWYGAIYLDIIENSYKKQTYYTLIGFKPNDDFTRKKVIETMTIQGSANEIKFGHSLINKGPGYVNRSIYEYSATSNMMLRYDKDQKMIVMDNLAPSDPSFKDVYRFYGPDFSYNGYKFEKGKWKLYSNIDLRNPKQAERVNTYKKDTRFDVIDKDTLQKQPAKN